MTNAAIGRWDRLIRRVGDRVLDADDASDFLGWHAGTMEYWVHAIVAAEARRLGAWAARTEVPYLTSARVASPLGEKWSDGAVAWPTGEGALIEAKAIVAHTAAKMRLDIRRKVAPDLDAMLGIEWDATCTRKPGRFEDPQWAERRGQITDLYALQILLVHGAEARDCGDLVTDALRQGVALLDQRYGANPPAWSSALSTTYGKRLAERTGGSGSTAATLFAWLTTLPVRSRQPTRP